MSTFRKVAWIIGCLVASLLVTWLLWELFVEGTVYRCTDAGTLSLGPWMSVDSHQSAGDRIQSGWTWERVTLIRRVCLFAFVALWLGGSRIALRLFRHHENAP
jgi:hypothetical protein